MSGISNGGMFMYYAGKIIYMIASSPNPNYLCVLLINFLASEMSDTIASIAPISGSPFLGFDNLPHSPISVIDFHGTDDDTIPYDANRY